MRCINDAIFFGIGILNLSFGTYKRYSLSPQINIADATKGPYVKNALIQIYML
jgi:hypothetical protein